MSKIEIHLEANTEQQLANLKAVIASELARILPGGTIQLGETEHMQGAASNRCNAVIWATIIAPLLTGSAIVGLQKALEKTAEGSCQVSPVQNGIHVAIPDGKIIIIVVSEGDDEERSKDQK